MSTRPALAASPRHSPGFPSAAAIPACGCGFSLLQPSPPPPSRPDTANRGRGRGVARSSAIPDPAEPVRYSTMAGQHHRLHRAAHRLSPRSHRSPERGLAGRTLYRPDKQAAVSLRDDIGLSPGMPRPNARGSSTPVRTVPSSGSIIPAPGQQPGRALPGTRSRLPFISSETAIRCGGGTGNPPEFLTSSPHPEDQESHLSSCRNRINSIPRPRLAFHVLVIEFRCFPGTRLSLHRPPT